MFQHADVGKCPAAPVVVPVSLALPLQSSGAAARRRHAAAGTGADRAPVFEHADLQLRTVSRVVVIQEVLRRDFYCVAMLLPVMVKQAYSEEYYVFMFRI